MICYIDSSALVRRYLSDEPHDERVSRLVADPEVVLVSGSWTRIEVTGALVRAGRASRGDALALINRFERDCAPAGGAIILLDVEQATVENVALALVRQYGLRAMDAWHLACAHAARAEIPAPDGFAFLTHDAEQAAAARLLGFAPA